MSEIFISYAHEDRPHSERLAHALEAQGWSVWWDIVIPAGKHFDDVIDEEMDAAKCVIVMWSKASVGSRYVRGEAHDAAERGILVPALIDNDIRIPRAFRAIQAADLVGWDGTYTATMFLRLTEDIAKLLGPPPILVERRRQAEAEENRRQAEAKRLLEQEEQRRQAVAEAERRTRDEERRRQAESLEKHQPEPTSPRLSSVEGSAAGMARYQPRVVDSFVRTHLFGIVALFGLAIMLSSFLWVMGKTLGWAALLLIILAALAVVGIDRWTSRAAWGGRTQLPGSYPREELLIVRGEYGEAAEYFRDHLKVEPKDNEARLRLADLLEQHLDDAADAERLYLEVRRASPDRSHELRATNGLIDLYRKQGRRDRLIVELARFAERFRGTPGAEAAVRLLTELKVESREKLTADG